MGLGGDLQREIQRDRRPHSLRTRSSSGQWPAKKRVLGGEKGFRGEDKAQHAQGRCRGVGGDMAKVDTKVGARVQPMS